MNNTNNYPSCIKIPTMHSKQSMTVAAQKDLQSLITINYELISVANRIFGAAKWNHSITSQTLDYVESILGKFSCACATFVKISLHDGCFHEEMGYYCGESVTKGLAIQTARLGSLTNAFEKALMCFGTTVQEEVKRVMKVFQGMDIDQEKEESRYSLNSLKSEDIQPCAQSTPFPKTSVEKKETVITKTVSHPRERSRSPAVTRIPASSTNIPKPKSPHEPKPQLALSSNNNTKDQVKNESNPKRVVLQQKNDIIPQKGEAQNGNDQTEQDQQKGLSEEELLRLERKRKQMEKQAEYKRLMKERELQKTNENKKPNPKY